MGRHLRRALIAVSALAALAGAFLAFRPAPVPVETEQVTRGRFEIFVEEDGRTRVRERYIVSAPLAGRVLRIGVRAGDAVAPGDVVAVILAAPSALLSARARREAEERVGAAEALLESAAALVERAKANRTQTELDAARARTLHQRGATPLQALERAELALRTAERDVIAADRRYHAAEHELAQARALLERADILGDGPERRAVRAPIAGRVLRVLQESEAAVVSGAPLLELGDPEELEVVVDVLTTEAVGIRPGAPVTLERWGGPAPLEGRVRRVEPGAFTRISALGVEEQRVWVVIDLVSPRERWAELGDGFRVDARITIEAIEDAVLVPASTLFRRGAGWAAFVVQDGVAREREVKVTRRAARHAMIAGGLVPGEVVVLFPPSALRDGARVSRTR